MDTFYSDLLYTLAWSNFWVSNFEAFLDFPKTNIFFKGGGGLL